MPSRRRDELTDFECSIIEPLLSNKSRGAPRVDNRTVLNGSDRLLRTGSPWSEMPERRGPPTTRRNRFVRWWKLGAHDFIFRSISETCDTNLQMIDSTSIRVCQDAANGRKEAARPTPPREVSLTADAPGARSAA